MSSSSRVLTRTHTAGQLGRLADIDELAEIADEWIHPTEDRRYRPSDFAPIAGTGVWIACGADAPAGLKAMANGVSTGSSASDTLVFAAALGQLGGREVIVAGSFTLNTSLSKFDVDNVRLRGMGNATVYTNDSTYPTPSVEIGGHRTALTTTWTDTSVAQGATTLNFSGTAPSLTNGQRIAFTTDEGYGSRPGENFAGEQMIVESVGASSVTFKTPFRRTYSPSAANKIKVYLYSMIKNCRIENLRVVGIGGTGHTNTGPTTNRERPFVVSYAEAPVIKGVYVEGPYAREGIAAYECYRGLITDWTVIDVNDLAGNTTTQPYEAYGVRVQGCEGMIVEKGYGRGGRHIVEINGGQSAYGLASNTYRPLSYGTIVRDVLVEKSWAAAVGDHCGSVGATFEHITANGTSGAVFSRGTQTTIRHIAYRGGHHQAGPYSANQGNDHCITLGEQQRNTDGTANNNTRDGISGTDVRIENILHDMTGNGVAGGSSASTSDTVHAVHPLHRAHIDLRGGKVRPSGSGVNAIGMFNEDVTILGVIDCTSSFSGAGQGVVLTPLATTPTPSTTGQYNLDIVIDVEVIKPRNVPVVISGSADSGVPSDRIDVNLSVKQLGSGMTSSSAGVRLGANPNGTTGLFGFVRLRELELTGLAKATAIDTSSATLASTLFWEGLSRFASGATQVRS